MRQASPSLRVGFVDNMGGAAGLGSERQFRDLLGGCAGGALDWTRIATHAGAAAGSGPRGPGGPPVPVRSARDLAVLPGLDLLVFSGAEPRGALQGEPFWPGLVALLDDAAARGRPVLLSCLAAHAALLHHDGLARDALPQKRAGVFRFPLDPRHPLVRRAAPGGGLPPTIAVAHSRCNEVSAAALEAAGYAVLSGDAACGVDMATARGRPWLLLQGHPEYGPATLIDQHRRDIGRFLRGARPDYPEPPVDGLEAEGAARFAAFAERALAAGAAGREALLGAVPQGRSNGAVRAADQAAVRALLGAWLEDCLAVAPVRAAGLYEAVGG